MRISVLTAANSSAVDDEWVPASRAGRSFHVSMYIISTPDAYDYEVSRQIMHEDEDLRKIRFISPGYTMIGNLIPGFLQFLYFSLSITMYYIL